MLSGQGCIIDECASVSFFSKAFVLLMQIKKMDVSRSQGNSCLNRMLYQSSKDGGGSYFICILFVFCELALLN